MKIPRRTFDAAIPSTAMGDIAFLLLIFFVILARALDDSHLVWRPAIEAELESTGNPVASVVIDADRKIFLNGRQVAVESLADALAERLGDLPAGRRTVHLKVDREVTALHFEPAIEAVGTAGGDLVHILEPEEAGRRQGPDRPRPTPPSTIP